MLVLVLLRKTPAQLLKFPQCRSSASNPTRRNGKSHLCALAPPFGVFLSSSPSGPRSSRGQCGGVSGQPGFPAPDHGRLAGFQQQLHDGQWPHSDGLRRPFWRQVGMDLLCCPFFVAHLTELCCCVVVVSMCDSVHPGPCRCVAIGKV